MYLELEDVKEIHIELTENCNASCPMCARNIHGSIANPELTQNQLGLDFFRDQIPWKELPNLQHIMLCGTFGDPIAAKDCLRTVKFFKEIGIPSVYLYTNGGARKKDWWRQLGEILRDSEDLVVFGIDGLSDTNHLYRRGVNWERLMENIRAFTGAGGRARWDFLVFRHNQHQVSAAKELANELGIEKFRLRKTSRFSAPSIGKNSRSFPVLRKSIDEKNISRLRTKKFSDDEIEYNLYEPTIQKYVNQDTSVNLPKLLQDFGSFENYMDSAKIHCIYREKFKRLYISADGKLWPCSYIGGDRLTWNAVHVYRDDIQKNVINRYGAKFNSLRLHSMKEILEHSWFSSDLSQSWQAKLSDESTPRLKKCARTCGVAFNPILSQSEDQKMKELEEKQNFDIFFLTYDEEYADQNWRKFKRRFPKAKRVQDIEGIYNAHKECANRSETEFFFVIDGDNEILPEFSFETEELDLKQNSVYVWRSKNPVNNLIYGYGGVKLFSRDCFRGEAPDRADMSTTIANGNYVVVHKLASVTNFNSTPYNAWRGAFRECAKLASQSIVNQNDEETLKRLHAWKYVWNHGARFGDWALSGAKLGASFGFQFANDPMMLQQINDFSWLKRQFEKAKAKRMFQERVPKISYPKPDPTVHL